MRKATSATAVFPLGELRQAIFVQRDNRFRAEVLLDGQPVKVHVPNSGRMKELLVPGAAVWVQPAAGAGRKTAYTLLLVQQGDRFVCLNAHLANELVAFWLAQGILPGFSDAAEIRREKTYGSSRFDFCLKRQDRTCYAEVKSVNLLDGSTARFPDAPTERGSKHLQELVRCKQNGLDAAVIFLVMGNAATDFAVNWATDPAFGQHLQEAFQAGVEIYVYTCQITLQGIRYTGTIPLQEEQAWKSMR
ncbi:MAG: DNA/RNA nuclease SfsA [Peptococcaceae bacterium]